MTVIDVANHISRIRSRYIEADSTLTKQLALLRKDALEFEQFVADIIGPATAGPVAGSGPKAHCQVQRFGSQVTWAVYVKNKLEIQLIFATSRIRPGLVEAQVSIVDMAHCLRSDINSLQKKVEDSGTEFRVKSGTHPAMDKVSLYLRGSLPSSDRETGVQPFRSVKDFDRWLTGIKPVLLAYVEKYWV